MMRVYHYRKDLNTEVKCDLGCKHRVTYHEAKEIALTRIESVFIEHLYYTHGGVGEAQYAEDYQGRRYRREQYWDGWTAWTRDDGKVFFDRPVIRADVAFDLAGNRIK